MLIGLAAVEEAGGEEDDGDHESASGRARGCACGG